MGRRTLIFVVVLIGLASSTYGAEGRRWALVIGVNDYKHLGTLECCRQDAEAVAKVLVENGGYDADRVCLIADGARADEFQPTYTNMLERFKQFTSLPKDGDTLLVFFTGHGITMDNEGYLMPVDGRDKDTGISMRWLRDKMNACNAANRILILDACHSGKAAYGVSGIAPSLAAGAATLVLSSCDEKEISYPDGNHGVFTAGLLAGLSGTADADKDGSITAGELFGAIQNHVETWAVRTGKTQTPRMQPETAGKLVVARAGPSPTSVDLRTEQPKMPDVVVKPVEPSALKELSAEKRMVNVVTPEGIAEKQITYYKNSIGMEFVSVPPTGPQGFMMGSPEDGADRVGNETQHRVILTKGFYMGATEVTQVQWQAVMGNNPSNFKGDDLPVEKVSSYDGTEFCRKLSAKEGRRYRLPTEAEWEYACRAGTTTPFNTGQTLSTEQANYDGNRHGGGQKGVYRQKTMPVGSLPANAWGLYDMHGNVFEWCADWYGDYPDPAGTISDPPGPANGEKRVVRGGNFFFNEGSCRSATRGRFTPDLRNQGVGFRVCLDSE